MAAEYHIFPEQKLIVSRINGKFSVEAVADLRRRVAEDPDYDPDFSVIDDVSGVTDVEENFPSMDKLAQGSVARPGVKRAVVAVTDLQFGMARMYQVVSEAAGQQMQVFRSMDEARAWIKKKD